MTGQDGDPGPDPAEDRDRRLASLLTVEVAVPPGVAVSGRRRRRRWPAGRVLAAGLLLALFAAGAGLVVAGVGVLRRSTTGEVIEPVTDPTAPGYEALVQPTPTLAVLHDVDGEIDAITVLTLPDPGRGGGGVVMVPTRIVTDLPVFGVAPLEAAYDLGSPSIQTEAVGDVMTTGIAEFAVVDADRWAGLVAPVAPLAIDNPDPLHIDGELRFPDGRISLEAADVGPFLEARVEGESELARLYRHEVFWEAWLAAVAAAATPDAVPGEVGVGLGHFVRTAAEGTWDVETLPVAASESEDLGPEPTFVTDGDAVSDLVARLVPFPRSPRPGVRPRVRVLNGTPDLDAATTVARSLPVAGVEITFIGNAASFDVDETTIAYAEEGQRGVAEAIRRVMGEGRVLLDPRPSDAVDITVTLGTDHD